MAEQFTVYGIITYLVVQSTEHQLGTYHLELTVGKGGHKIFNMTIQWFAKQGIDQTLLFPYKPMSLLFKGGQLEFCSTGAETLQNCITALPLVYDLNAYAPCFIRLPADKHDANLPQDTRKSK